MNETFEEYASFIPSERDEENDQQCGQEQQEGDQKHFDGDYIQLSDDDEHNDPRQTIEKEVGL